MKTSNSIFNLNAKSLSLAGVILFSLFAVSCNKSSDLPAGPLTVQTALTGKTFDINASILQITDLNGREAGLVSSLLNIQATNGVIHVIDRVIMPK